MDRKQQDMQFLGLFGIYLESFKILFNFKSTFSKITLASILPLSLIYLAFEAIKYDPGTQFAKGLIILLITFVLLVFSLPSTSAVVHAVASVYTGRDVTFGNVMTVVRIPKVAKRLMVTSSCTILTFYLYLMVLEFFMVLWRDSFQHVQIIGPVSLFVIVVLYTVGFVYMAVFWQLAHIVSVLEDVKGFEAMAKSRDLLEGKMWIAVVIFLKLQLVQSGIKILFKCIPLHTESSFFSIVPVGRLSFGIAGRLGFGFLCLLLLMIVFLFGLIFQTVIYFVCKSYHHENIDYSPLSNNLPVYLDENGPLKAKDVEHEQLDV